jgi:hypothetical protein
MRVVASSSPEEPSHRSARPSSGGDRARGSCYPPSLAPNAPMIPAEACEGSVVAGACDTTHVDPRAGAEATGGGAPDGPQCSRRLCCRGRCHAPHPVSARRMAGLPAGGDRAGDADARPPLQGGHTLRLDGWACPSGRHHGRVAWTGTEAGLPAHPVGVVPLALAVGECVRAARHWCVCAGQARWPPRLRPDRWACTARSGRAVGGSRTRAADTWPAHPRRAPRPRRNRTHATDSAPCPLPASLRIRVPRSAHRYRPGHTPARGAERARWGCPRPPPGASALRRARVPPARG